MRIDKIKQSKWAFTFQTGIHIADNQINESLSKTLMERGIIDGIEKISVEDNRDLKIICKNNKNIAISSKKMLYRSVFEGKDFQDEMPKWIQEQKDILRTILIEDKDLTIITKLTTIIPCENSMSKLQKLMNPNLEMDELQHFVGNGFRLFIKSNSQSKILNELYVEPLVRDQNNIFIQIQIAANQSCLDDIKQLVQDDLDNTYKTLDRILQHIEE